MKQLITLTALLFFISFSFSQTKEQDSLAIQLAFQSKDTIKVKTSIRLIKSLYKTKDYQKALDYIQQSEKLATSLKYNKGTAEIRYYKALIYTKNDDYYNALDNYTGSLKLFTQLKDSLSIAKVHNSLGLVEIKRGNYKKGLRHSLSAIQIFEIKNLKEELSTAYNCLAEAYYNTNHIDKALQFNLKALKVREELKDSTGIKLSTKNIAELYSLRKEHRKSIEYYQKTLNLLDSIGDTELRGQVLPSLGEEYLRFKDFDNATPFITEGLAFNRSIQNKQGILKSLNNMANLNLLQNNISLARQQLNQAYNLTNEVNDDVELLKHYKLRVNLDSINNNFDSAFNWQRQYHQLKTTLDKEKISPMQIEDDPFEIESPVIETPVNTKNGKKFPANLLDYEELTYIAYGLIALFLILLISFITSFINSNKKDKEIEEHRSKKREYILLNKDITEQNNQLEELNHVKDRLFSIVSHDLKDSITSIKAFLDLLKEDSISEQEFNDLIPELSENADNASALLLNLLNWSKSQMQNLEPKPEMFNIQEVFREKIQLVEKKVQKKRVVLLDESNRDLAYADRSMMEIVIQNLLANAIKFSRVGDVITVSNRERNGNVLITIEDTGVGISEENQKQLFGAGGLTTRGTNDEKGTGLGLSICKQLVEMNNGKIWVESEVGLGSKFFVEIPKTRPSS